MGGGGWSGGGYWGGGVFEDWVRVRVRDEGPGL